MSYVKTQWVNGDTITADKLNHIEAGIEANEAENSLVKSHLNATEIVDTASGAIASFADGSDGVPVRGLTVQIEPIQSGTGDPSPDNVRPISGRQSVTVTRAGVNVWDEQLEEGGINDSTGEKVSASPQKRSQNYISVYPGTNYYATALNIGTGGIYIYFYDSAKVFIGRAINSEGYYNLTNQTFTTPNNCRYIMFKAQIPSSGTWDTVKFSINYPSTDHDYHSGTVATVEIPLGQTVYGGTLDVVNGEMVVDRAYYAYNGTENFALYGDGETSRRFVVTLSGTSANGICSHGIITTVNFGIWGQFRLYASGNFEILDNESHFADVDALKTYLASQYASGTPLTVVYELAQPITITLTPEQLTTVLGVNNVWSDADSVSVDYVADTKLYIEQLTEPDADMVADANITSGQYFMVGNNLYLATANIASGAAISPGVNCTRTSLAAALNAINS